MKEIHVLTCQDDLELLRWCLKSLSFFAEDSFRVIVHGDGTLKESVKSATRTIQRDEADKEMVKTLSSYPNCLRYRKERALSLKVFDFYHYAVDESYLIMDSDVLFFDNPVELFENTDKNLHMRDCKSAYCVDNGNLIPRINTGLGVIQKKSIVYSDIESWLNQINWNAWSSEQTLYAFASTKFGCDFLPDSYRIPINVVESGYEFVSGVEKVTCKHYVNPIRRYFWQEGVSYLEGIVS